MGSDIRAGGAFVEIFVKGNIGPQLDKVAAKLKSVGDSITNVGKKLAGVGAAIVAPLVLAAERFASMGDEINKASQRTGIAVESLQELKYAAEQSGASFGDLESGIKKMQKAVFAAASGNKEAEKSLRGIGLSVNDLKGLSPDEQFLKIAEALNGVKNEAARTAIAMEIFGKGGAQLLPLMSEGAEGIKKLSERARELGLIFSAEDAEAATKFGDTLDDLKKQLSAVLFNVGSAVANALQPFADAAIRCMTSVIAWVKENRTLVVGMLTAGVAFLAAGAALISLGLSIKLVGTAISGIRAGFAAISTVLGLLLNPIVLIGAGLVALAGYFIFASDTGQAVVDYLKAKFTALADIAKETFGGIADALAAGDISLAAQILWAGLQAAWAEGTADLNKRWADFKAGFVQVAAAAFYGTLEIWENVKASMKETWAELVSWVKGLWQGFANFFSDLWDGITDSIAKGINSAEALVTGGDATERNAMIDKDAQQRNAIKGEDRNKESGDREKAKNDAIMKARQDQAKAVKELNDAEMSLSAGASQMADEEKKAIAEKIAKLKEELATKRATAKTEGDKARADDAIKKPTLTAADRAEDLDNLVSNRGDLNAKSAGIFNAAGIQGLQAQTWNTIAKNTEETAKASKEIAKNTKLKTVFN